MTREYLKEKIKGCEAIQRIRGEASERQFFRLNLKSRSLVAMVYPENCNLEIAKMLRMAAVYCQYGILVPAIREVVAERIVLLEDLGDLLVQRVFRNQDSKDKLELLKEICRILLKIREVPQECADARLFPDRMHWEMDFFISHFASPLSPSSSDLNELGQSLHELVDRIEASLTFAHRDFHSRNMLFHQGKIYLVDFQDSLLAPDCYDLVSFAFDSYLDLARWRAFLWDECGASRYAVDRSQLFLTALQRNIKALGTFGYQVFACRHLIYRKYMTRTIGYILENLKQISEEFIPYLEDFFGRIKVDR